MLAKCTDLAPAKPPYKPVALDKPRWLRWYEIIPGVNLLHDIGHTIDDLEAFDRTNNTIGLVTALLLGVIMSLPTAVDYAECEAATARAFDNSTLYGQYWMDIRCGCEIDPDNCHENFYYCGPVEQFANSCADAFNIMFGGLLWVIITSIFASKRAKNKILLQYWFQLYRVWYGLAITVWIYGIIVTWRLFPNLAAIKYPDRLINELGKKAVEGASAVNMEYRSPVTYIWNSHFWTVYTGIFGTLLAMSFAQSYITMYTAIPDVQAKGALEQATNEQIAPVISYGKTSPPSTPI